MGPIPMMLSAVSLDGSSVAWINLNRAAMPFSMLLESFNAKSGAWTCFRQFVCEPQTVLVRATGRFGRSLRLQSPA